MVETSAEPAAQRAAGGLADHATRDALADRAALHARILNGLLSAALAEYGRKFGPIPSDAGTPNVTGFTSRDTHN